MRQIEVMQIGSQVKIANTIDAVITGISIGEKCHIKYECVWWDGRTRKSGWLEQSEIQRSLETQSMKIGFQ